MATKKDTGQLYAMKVLRRSICCCAARRRSRRRSPRRCCRRCRRGCTRSSSRCATPRTWSTLLVMDLRAAATSRCSSRSSASRGVGRGVRRRDGSARARPCGQRDLPRPQAGECDGRNGRPFKAHRLWDVQRPRRRRAHGDDLRHARVPRAQVLQGCLRRRRRLVDRRLSHLRNAHGPVAVQERRHGAHAEIVRGVARPPPAAAAPPPAARRPGSPAAPPHPQAIRPPHRLSEGRRSSADCRAEACAVPRLAAAADAAAPLAELGSEADAIKAHAFSKMIGARCTRKRWSRPTSRRAAQRTWAAPDRAARTSPPPARPPPPPSKRCSVNLSRGRRRRRWRRRHRPRRHRRRRRRRRTRR